MMLLRTVVLLVVAVLATSCTHEQERLAESATPTSLTNSASAESDVGPDDLPRTRWTGGDGRSTEEGMVNVIRGPAHCDYETSLWLHLGWPPGTPAETDTQMRQYVRDPEDILGLADGLDVQAVLPEAASATEFSADGVELWLGEDGGDAAVYLVFRDHVERWPRSPQIIACA